MTHVVNQISAFLEHKPGTLADFCAIFLKAGIDMKALSLAKATDFGVVRVVVDELEAAQEALRQAGQIFSITQVVAAEFDDEPGSLSRLLDKLKKENINIKYCYSVKTNINSKAQMLVRVDNSDIERTLEVLNRED